MNINKLYLPPIDSVSGDLNLPGSKSISNRALLLAALSQGRTTLTNLLESDDVSYMLAALKQLNIPFDYNRQQQSCIVEGDSRGEFLTKQAIELYLGNAGTAMRPLTAVLSLSKSGCVTLTGDPRMQERPIAHLVTALQEGGANIQYDKIVGYPPITLRGGYVGGTITVAGNISSQFLTALLIASPLAEQDSTIVIKDELVSKPYIDLTLAMLRQFGVHISHDNYQTFHISGGQIYKSPRNYWIEGDASSASYFLAAAAINRGSVIVRGIGRKSLQGDIYFANVLEKMGANITWGKDFIQCKGERLVGIDMDMNHIPDAAMTIAVLALFAKGTTTLRNIYNWRVKETDRLSAMSAELRKVGATVFEGEDFIRITPPVKIKHAEIATYNDHRMAMCFSLLSLAESGVTILNPECTAKTFPNYFEQLQHIAVYQTTK